MHVSLPTSRREIIAGRLHRGDAVIATALAEEFGISEDAIRRDLRALAAAGRCKRVYGGALPLSSATGSLEERVSVYPKEKVQLARAAVRATHPRGLIFLDGGSTNLALVSELPGNGLMTVATNSIPVADAVLRRHGVALILVGGAVDADLAACIDADAVRALEKLNIDHCFLGACAVSYRLGLGVFHPGEAQFKRVLLSRSQQTTVMVTHDKLETRAPHVIAPLKAIQQLIIPHGTSSHLLRLLRKAGPKILTADRPADRLNTTKED